MDLDDGSLTLHSLTTEWTFAGRDGRSALEAVVRARRAIIGRDTAAEVRVLHRDEQSLSWISRHHVELVRTGRWWSLTDVSKHGTELRAPGRGRRYARLVHGMPYPILDDVHVRLAGRMEFAIRCEEPAYEDARITPDLKQDVGRVPALWEADGPVQRILSAMIEAVRADPLGWQPPTAEDLQDVSGLGRSAMYQNLAGVEKLLGVKWDDSMPVTKIAYLTEQVARDPRFRVS